MCVWATIFDGGAGPRSKSGSGGWGSRTLVLVHEASKLTDAASGRVGVQNAFPACFMEQPHRQTELRFGRCGIPTCHRGLQLLRLRFDA